MLAEALKHISLRFLDFAEARRTTDSQPLEYGVAYALGKAIEGVLLATPAYEAYQCIPESRPLVPQPAAANPDSSKNKTKTKAPNPDSSKNKTSYLDWKIRNGEVVGELIAAHRMVTLQLYWLAACSAKTIC